VLHFALPTRRQSSALTVALTPGAYLALRRAAAGYTPEAFTRAFIMVQDHDRPRPVTAPSIEETRQRFRQTRNELALLERPRTVARDQATLRAIASVIPFDIDVYRQLAAEPADRHPRICRGCGCSGHDACSTDDAVCRWVTPDVCSHCFDRNIQRASAAA
jgi:hypothetical protein